MHAPWSWPWPVLDAIALQIKIALQTLGKGGANFSELDHLVLMRFARGLVDGNSINDYLYSKSQLRSAFCTCIWFVNLASERRVMELLLESTILDAELSAERRDENVGDDSAHSSNPFAHRGTPCLAT